MSNYSVEQVNLLVGDGKKYDLETFDGKKELVSVKSLDGDIVTFEILNRGMMLFIDDKNLSELEKLTINVNQISSLTAHDDNGWTPENISKLR